MIAVVATLRVQEGRRDEFERIIRDLTGRVRANEPGTLLYQLARSRTGSNTYKMIELYLDEEAQNQHRGARHVKELGQAMVACLDGATRLEVLDAIE